MTFTWHFYTSPPPKPPTPSAPRCYRGPMTAFEILMSKPFTMLTPFNTLRRRLLDAIVDTDLVSVRTREVTLRCINGSNQALFPRLYTKRSDLQARICEKRDSVSIYEDLASLLPFYITGANDLCTYGLSKQYAQTIVAALQSNSPVVIVEGMCAVILWASFLEYDAVSLLPSTDPAGYGEGLYGYGGYGA